MKTADDSSADPPPQFRVRTTLIGFTLVAISLGTFKACVDYLKQGTVTEETIGQVSYGVERSEVEKLLGPPASSQHDQRVWWYYRRFDTNLMQEPIGIFFDEKGRVTEVSPGW